MTINDGFVSPPAHYEIMAICNLRKHEKESKSYSIVAKRLTCPRWGKIMDHIYIF
jgi:hypothetical protein